jgi:predicted transcriptional regulator
VNRKQAQDTVVSYLLKKFFNGSPEMLVVNLLEHEEVDQNEIKRLKRLIEKSK